MPQLQSVTSLGVSSSSSRTAPQSQDPVSIAASWFASASWHAGQWAAMKLYSHKRVPKPRRLRVFLAEKGIDVPTQEIDIFTRENRKPEFLTKNPLGGIPVLVLDDGTHIAESVAICRYFEALQPKPALFGVTPLEQA